MFENKEIAVVGYYKLFEVSDVDLEVSFHRTCIEKLGGKCRIYVSDNGVNAQLSIKSSCLEEYSLMLEKRYGKSFIELKVQYWEEHVFPRITVKCKRELVAINCGVDPYSRAGMYLDAKQWDEKLCSEEEKVLIDARNSYEWKVGHFEGFDDPQTSSFRDFKQFVSKVKNQHGLSKPVMMYCTGGIRCEILSRFMIQCGFQNIYQLDGGVIKYGQKGGNCWKGKLFVFDDRLCVDISEKKSEEITSCLFCKKTSSVYYNCANMDCNELFISCRECIPIVKGCCRVECQIAHRLRPFDESKPHRPFKKGYYKVNAGGRT